MGKATAATSGGAIRSYRDLRAWQRAMELVDVVYRVSESWPQREVYGLTQQIRRAVVSVPSNIAEGQGRRGSREYLHALSIANGSLYEVETQLLIAQQQRYVSTEQCDSLLDHTSHIGRLIYGLMRRLQNPAAPSNDKVSPVPEANPTADGSDD